jgi:(heptosyl)LPS beta-1,4-glucosyltransferase
MAAKLTVVINTLNEANVLPRVLDSTKSLASEVVVVDMESDDGSPEVAKKLGAKVYSHKRLSHVEPARNFGISKASGDWILVLDVDEEVSSSLAKKIKEIINKVSSADYYRIPRKNLIFGHWMKYSRWWPDYNIRLFRKGFVSWTEIIHAVPMTQGKGADFEVKEDLAITHHHYDSIEKYIGHMDRYTSVQAEAKVKSGYKFSWRDLLVRPSNEFLSRYFGGEGFKDGIYGLALSLLQSCSELVLYLKIWQAEKFKDQKASLPEVISEMREREKDLHYWQGDSMFKESGRLKDRVIRKLRI